MPSYPYRHQRPRRSLAGTLLLALGGLVVLAPAVLAMLWALGVPLPLLPRDEGLTVGIPVNVRPIRAYERVIRDDLTDPDDLIEGAPEDNRGESGETDLHIEDAVTDGYPTRAYPHLWVALMRTSAAIAALSHPTGRPPATCPPPTAPPSSPPRLRVLEGGSQQTRRGRRRARRAGTTPQAGQATG